MVERGPEENSVDNRGFTALVTGVVMILIGSAGLADKQPSIVEAAKYFTGLGAIIVLAGIGAIALARRRF